METEKASHDTEENLLLAQFGIAHNANNLIKATKIQNGSQSPVEVPTQINGDENWNEYKQSARVTSMKRERENCNSPATIQGLLDQESYMMNGEMKHALTDQSLLVQQPKKLRMNSDITGDKDIGSGLVDNFSELTNLTEFDCNALPNETKVDKNNTNFPNGDIFSFSRNKQVLIPNGDVASPSTMEGTPGDLLEKTLSQYYPEQVSIAPQTSGSHPSAVNGSLTGELPKQDAQPPSLTSGFSNSVQITGSEHQQPGAAHNTKDGNNYNSAPYVVNGYSNNYGDHQHQQQQQKPYSGQERKLSLGQLSDISPPTNTANRLQPPQNGANAYPEHSNRRSIYGKANREFNQNPYSEHNNSPQTGDEGCFRPFPNPGMKRAGQNEEAGSGKHNGLQYGIQPQSFQQHSGNSCGGPQQSHISGVDSGMEAGDSMSQQKINLSHHAPNQRGWIDLGSPQQRPPSGPPSQSHEHMWRGFPSRPQPEQTTNSQAQSQMLESDTVQAFQTQGGFTDSNQVSKSFQQHQQLQDCLPAQSHCAKAQHNTAPEWQQSNTKAAPTQQPLSQKMPQPCNLPQQQQSDSRYQTRMQPEHLCEGDPDLQEILSPGFLPQQHCQQQQHNHEHQQQRPLSHPSQFEGQQLKSPNYRPHSQPPPGQQQIQAIRTSPILSNPQHPQHSDQVAFTYSNATEMQQLQRQYAPNSGSSNLQQYPPQQSTPKSYQSNPNDFPMSTTQSQHHLPQGTVNKQVPTQIYPKAEPQQHESCAQLQRGPQLPLGPSGLQGDFQRHAALRMHLLQRQERQGPPPHPDFKQGLRAVKMENGPRFEPPRHQQQDQQLQGQDVGMGNVQVKQEPIQSMCKQSSKQGSILATMEQSLRQYQLSPVFEKKSLVINSSKVKVESSGSVTVLSTNTDLSTGVNSSSEALKRPPEFTPKKEPLLQSFMDSPMKLLDTPIKNLLDTPIKTQYDIASCHCMEQISEKDEGPYYTHLGAAPSVAGIREVMEKRSGLTGSAIRIEKVIYTGKEGKSTQGCPIAKWVIRRAGVEEKLVVLVRERTGHTCKHACIIVVLLIWEGIAPSLADRLYLELSDTLTKHGALTQRRCALNEERTCACQGLDPEASGASFSFGCSWSMYYNGCKFARSKIPRKFKLLGDDPREEEKLEQNLQNLATLLAPTYKTMAPEAYGNQVEHEHRAPDCRLGQKEGRPFSGVTACMDFCAHAHRDLHNMQGGSTVVCTLTREDNRGIGKIPEDEQLHVLPLYKASNTDEFGSEEGQQEKIKSGAIQVLSAFRRQVRMLAEPAKSCRQKKLDAKKAAANKNAILDLPNVKAEKALHAKSKAGTLENSAQSTPGTGPIPGAMGANSQPSQPLHPLGTPPQQHHNMLTAYPGSSQPVNYPRFSNHPGIFSSTSKPGSMYPQPPTPTSPYPSPLHVPNSFMNGSNRPYPGYQCNGGMPLDNYHAYYASNPKHLDMYQQQSPTLCPEQQYSVHQRYEVKYPPRYGDPGLQVNGYSTCSMRPRVHPMGPYSPYGPNGSSDTQYIDALSRPPSGHPNMDYAAAVSKGNQFAGYPNPYLSQSSQMFPSGQDPFRMQIKTELGVSSPQMLPTSLGGECLTSGAQSGLGLPNGSFLGASIKQEPVTLQTPTTPQKPEMWSDNEHNFLDPDIGGVAVAPTHGSILIECAKRELHATTPLKNPDRNHPTRISLVFYQHKNMNEAKHGLAMWEAKMAEKAREKEEDAEKNGGEGTPSKSSKKGAKREHPESLEPSGEPPYKRFIQTLIEGSLSCTTNTYVSTTPYAFTKVTGPYSRFV